MLEIENKEIAKLLIDSSQEGIVIVNEKGKIVFTNESLINMFGYHDNSELLNKSMEILIPMKHRTNHTSYRASFKTNPSKRKMGSDKVLTAQRKDGTQFSVEIGLNHIQTKKGILISATVSDISERIEIQNKLTKLNIQLEEKVKERTQELENAILELQESNQTLETQFEITKKAEERAQEALQKEKDLGELKSRFVSMASHEFRTPLSSVLSSNSLIKKYLEKNSSLDEDLRDKTEKHINRISNSVKNLNEILNDLLSLSKMEEGKLECNKTEFCIKELYIELYEEMSTYLKKDQKIEISHQGNSSIVTDRHLLHNTLLNLTSNASKYSNEGKKIKILSSNENNILSINIIDQGIGIPKDDKKHMFDRFFRAKNVTNIQGTGLGLNIVKNYLELINGNITFTSELDKGSEFSLKINLK